MKFWKLTDRLRVFKPVQTKGNFGTGAVEYHEQPKLIWCDRNKHTGTFHEEVGELFPGYISEFRVRIENAVPELWRVSMVGEEKIVYVVKNVIRDRKLGMATLICERINP